MTSLARALTLCGAIAGTLLSLGSAEAQPFTRTWVASTGSDAALCTRSAPCASFGAALANTVVGGFIHCVDAANFSSVNITKSITIDCHAFGKIGVCGVAIVINIPPGTPGDPRRIVRLRNLSVDGSVFNGVPCGDKGILIGNAAAVSIENVVAENYTQRGISDERTTSGRLTVTNSILRNNGGTGLVVLSASGPTRIDVAVDNVVAEGNSYGMAFNSGAKAMVNRSFIVNNIFGGIDSENSGTEVAVDNSTISNNGTALLTFTGGVLDVSNSNIAFNAQVASGAWFSFGNNRIHRNGAFGTVPTSIGGPTHDLGQM